MDHVIAEQRQGVSNRCPRIYFTAGIRKASGSRGLCSSEDEIPLDDPRHQMPVGFAAKPEPIHIGNNPGRELGPRPRMMCEGIHL